jgi:hypothetical protein
MANQQTTMSSGPPPPPVSDPLLALPDVLLLKVAEHLSNSVKYRNPQGDLLNFALTCKSLAPLAREVLFQAPILNSSKTAALISTLFKYHGLRGKSRSLTIESRKTRGRQAEPTPIQSLDAGLLRACVEHIHTLPTFNQAIKHAWIADIKRNEFTYPGTLLSLLFTMLPKLTALYLGGSTLVNFPLFHGLLPNVSDAKMPAAWSNGPNLTLVLRLLGPKLKVLELPNSFHISPKSQSWQVPDVSGIPSYFPNLGHLVVASNAVYETACEDIIGPKLERLTLTDAGDPDVDNWVHGLWRSKAQYFPNLTKVEVCYGKRVLAAKLHSRNRMRSCGIECKFRPSITSLYEPHTDLLSSS